MNEAGATIHREPMSVAGTRATRTRFLVLAFVVAAYFITYLDRVLLSVATPFIQREFSFDTITMGWVLFSYSIAYAIFQIPGGWFGDRAGPRIALACVVIWWSLLTALTTLAWSAVSMGCFLFLIGMGEAGSFPISNRALSRWMLPSERAFAQGTTHAGSRSAAALTPVIVVALVSASSLSWRLPFLLFAGVGLVWAIGWYAFYRNSPSEHPRVNAAENAAITSALGTFSSRRQVPWKQILSNPQMWLLGAMYFCYAYDIGTFLSWFPKYLNAARGIELTKMGLFASLPFLAGLLGDISGGLISDALLKRTSNVRFARRVVLAVGFWISAGAIIFAALASSIMLSIGLFAIGLFALELTVGVSWAVTLDVGGEFAGSVSAVMNTLGNLGAAIAVALTAWLASSFGWASAFAVIAGLAVLAGGLAFTIDASRSLFRKDEEGVHA